MWERRRGGAAAGDSGRNAGPGGREICAPRAGVNPVHYTHMYYYYISFLCKRQVAPTTLRPSSLCAFSFLSPSLVFLSVSFTPDPTPPYPADTTGFFFKIYNKISVPRSRTTSEGCRARARVRETGPETGTTFGITYPIQHSSGCTVRPVDAHNTAIGYGGNKKNSLKIHTYPGGRGARENRRLLL